MTELPKLFIDSHGVQIVLHSDNKGFLSFVEDNYTVFLAKKHIRKDDNIIVCFSKKAGHFARRKKQQLIRLGEGLYRGNNSFYWENEFGFSIYVEMPAINKWIIKGFHFDLYKDPTREEVLKNYQRSMRWMIHFPIFCMLDKFKGFKLVHASAVSKNGKAIVLAGLNKVGKSSLSRYLFENKEYKYLSDNFLLTDGQYVYAFPERGRLAPDSLKNLNIQYKNKEIVYGKAQTVFQKEDIEMKARPVCVFIVGNSSLTSLKQIDNDLGEKTLEGLHAYLKEFPEYSFYSVLKSFSFWSTTKSHLFNNRTKFYQLTFPFDWSLEKTSTVILQCI